MEWVPQCYGDANDVKLGAFGVSEPDAGSDVSNLRTRAVYDEANDEWVLNGTKAWITNGGIADVHVVVAAVDPELKGRGQASFVIPPNTKGLSQGQKYMKHGIRASHTAEVVLDDVRIPGSCLLGGKENLDAKLARAREAGKSGAPQPAMKTFEATPGRWGTSTWYCSSCVRVFTRVRERTPCLRQADHHEPSDCIQVGKHDHRNRCESSADLACRVACS